jgi:hypothetical protein
LHLAFEWLQPNSFYPDFYCLVKLFLFQRRPLINIGEMRSISGRGLVNQKLARALTSPSFGTPRYHAISPESPPEDGEQWLTRCQKESLPPKIFEMAPQL